MAKTASDFLAAGDVAGLLAHNASIYGDARCARGYNAVGDVFPKTADGRDLADLLAEFRQVADLANTQQQRFVDLFTAPTTSAVTTVMQSVGSAFAFEKASEFGVPQKQRTDLASLNMGATFDWYDLGVGWTWQFLADATAAQLEAHVSEIVSADASLVFRSVMAQIFRSTARTVDDQATATSYPVLPFANADGWNPPSYAGNSWSGGTHSHFRVSGAATVTSGDLDEITDDLTSHGLSSENGSTQVLFVNPIELAIVSTFRVATGARADFVRSTGTPAYYEPAQLLGTQPAGTYAGFPVAGQYGEMLIVSDTRIPSSYLVGLASGGVLSPRNPLMLREHPKPELRGLKLVTGPRQDYPLIDSYWCRGFGLGISNRLSGIVMQVKASGSYTPPAQYS